MMSSKRTSRDWQAYYERTGQRPPRETLLHALGLFEASGVSSGFAVDLGSGGGRDVVELLRRGWQVLAVDAEATAVTQLRERRDLPSGHLLETKLGRFEDLRWPACDLVNSSFALPLCPREAFLPMWDRIVASLRPGGRFAGQFFGDRDEWAGNPTITHLTRAEAEGLLEALDVEYFEEMEGDSVTPRGRSKFWHTFHVVARRP